MTRRALGWCLGTLIFTGAATAAAPQTKMEAVQIDAIRTCRSILPADQRLACFDRTSAELDDAIQKHDLTVLDKADITRTRRSLFGFEIPNIALFGGGTPAAERSPEFTKLSSFVTAIRPLGHNIFEITIEDGAVWRNSDELDFPPKRGTKVDITKGALGNYFLVFNGDRAIRGSRIR